MIRGKYMQKMMREIVTMKCTNCGLPLSPSRTDPICPRCGTPTGSGQKATSTQAQQQYQQVYWGNAGTVQAGAGIPPQNEQWAQTAQGSPSNLPLSPLPEYQQGVVQPAFSQPRTRPLAPRAIRPPTSRNTRLGFIVAGLCVLTGGFILILVYFMAIGLPGGNSNNTVAPPVVSKATTAPTATTAPSPTATVYPGQQYIDNAQMASAINATRQPTQLSTTFKTNQKIYVTFQLHPAGHGGAVCLLWYLNGRQVSQYSFPVSANSRLSYAYSIYGSTGTAYVEIYWASTPQCTDQVLAQHVDFTVTT